jgi:multimeric flavodoxin WrbA
MKILSVCGSPRTGNSEAILFRLKEIFEKKGIENQIILLRDKKIERCDGCMEYCNKNLDCHKKDDMPKILDSIKQAEGFIFACPNYFKMPPGLFKDFIDRSSVIYTAKLDLSKKRAVVICVGADVPSETNTCLNNIAKNFVETLGIRVVAKKSLQGNSELKGNPLDIFSSNLNPGIEKELEKMAEKLIKSLR